MDAIAKRSFQKKTDGEICYHYWVIEYPVRPTSMGICKLCGCEREFANSFDDLRSSAFARRKPLEEHDLAET